jgi:hypothetical protein
VLTLLDPDLEMSSMRLSAALSPVGTEGSDRLIRGMGHGPFPSMPRADPIEMQNAVCEAIARLIRDGPPETIQLEALFALERQAQPVTELLLAQYVEGDGQIGSFEWKAWHSALRLSQWLFQANEYFLQHIQKTADNNWTEHEPWVQVRLFHHRKVDFLLRFLRYKKRSPELWRQLHEMYRLAHERDLLHRPDANGETDGRRRTMRKLEQQYLQILLLEAMNSGQFSPREALWAHRWFARWSGGPGLRLAHAGGRPHFEPKGFVVDLDSADGLKRVLVAGGTLLYFDSSPLSAMIDQEIASLRDGAPPHQAMLAVRAGQLALLNKLSILFAPNPVNIERRAARIPISAAVQAIAGFPNIVEELWKNSQKQTDGISSAATPGNDQSISSLGVPTFSPLFAANADAGPGSLSISSPFDAIPQIWQVKDRSDSGCRMRAQIDNLNLVIPGSLIAVRDNETTPWIVSVVRWFRRLMVDHVEIGVEYLGREPRFVKMIANCDGDSAIVDAPDRASKCFAALYFPPSEEHPTMPIKTLLFPAREFRIGCDVTLLSSNATYTMRLNEPIQQQFEYVWTSFSVVDRVTTPPSKVQ